jgi:hypothetical protein
MGTMPRLKSGTTIIALALLVACVRVPTTRQILWSPDALHAAVITADGLYLSKANGTLSPLVAPDVYAAAWLSDSTRLVVARRRVVNNLSALADALGPARTRELVVKADAVWQQIDSTNKLGLDARLEALSGLFEREWELKGAWIYLREHHDDAIREKLGEQWSSEDLSVRLSALAVVTVVGDRLEFGPTLLEDVVQILAIRPSPDGHTVAFVAGTEDSSSLLSFSPTTSDLRLWAVPIDGATTAVVIGDPAAGSFDWTPQGSLVYLEASDTGNDEEHLGNLVERAVLDANNPPGWRPARVLARLTWQPGVSIRCLPDGRLLFNAPERKFPTTDLTTREHLFVIDRTASGVPSVTSFIPRTWIERLPASLVYTVSPDTSQVLFADKDEVIRLSLADGAIERLPQGVTGFDGPQSPLPAWRGKGEFTYVKNEAGRNEIVLRRGDSEIVLSRDWPDALLQPLGSKR